MNKPGTMILAVAALASLAACGAKKDEGGLTAADNQELNNAAEMLDASPDSLVASGNVALGNGEEAAGTAVETEANAADNQGEVARGNSE
jgi:hypothetical protein